MRKPHEAFPRSRTSYFRFACLFSRRSYYLRAWQRLEKNILRVWDKRDLFFVFFSAIARHFFSWFWNYGGILLDMAIQNNNKKLLWRFFHKIKFLSWFLQQNLSDYYWRFIWTNPLRIKSTLTTPCELRATLTFSPSLPFRPGSPGGPCN